MFDLYANLNIFPCELRDTDEKTKKQSPRCVLWKGACSFIKKETLAQVFSCKFCEIPKNTFFYRTPLVAASKNFTLKILKFFRKLS